MDKTIVVTTTIRVPTFLKDLCQNARRYGHEAIEIIVIGDMKTPAETAGFCNQLAHESRYPVDYLSISAQEKALKDKPALLTLMPLNHGSRKMIGNFLAYRRGATQLIMIDDDNFITDADFFGAYASVGKSAPLTLVKSSTGWYNVYEAVVEERGIPFYPRAYPWSQRTVMPAPSETSREKIPLVAKNGFVLEDPDVDAITRLFWPIRVSAMRPEFEPEFGLYPGTWSSFNNQNTALSRELIPAYFTPPSTGRNADIWTAYVVCALAGALGGAVGFGHPLVRQIRNPHNLWKDLDDEALNDRATDRFVELLRAVPVNAKTYLAALIQLMQGMRALIDKASDLAADERGMMSSFCADYLTWSGLFTQAND